MLPCGFATGDTDDRAFPSHAKKLTATLQEVAKGKSTVLLRVEKKMVIGLESQHLN